MRDLERSVGRLEALAGTPGAAGPGLSPAAAAWFRIPANRERYVVAWEQVVGGNPAPFAALVREWAADGIEPVPLGASVDVLSVAQLKRLRDVLGTLYRSERDERAGKCTGAGTATGVC